MSKTPLTLDALRAALSKEHGPRYWRSLEELAESEGFQELLDREFPRQASEWAEGVSRRRALELMAASLSLAGLTACTRQPREKIVPYVRQPEDLLPGEPQFYATAMPLNGSAVGLLVESHTGRPTKVEGNPEHPSSFGATDAWAQAAPLSLYDPDRSQTITHLGEIRTWNAFVAELKTRLAPLQALGGAGLRILTESIASPTLDEQLRALFAAYPKARWTVWNAVSRENVKEGVARALGTPADALYDFSQADVVLTLDADPFAYGPGWLVHARQFARRRRVTHETTKDMPRFYAIESSPTPSGTLADERLTLAPSDVGRAAAALASMLGLSGADASAAGGKWSAFLSAAAADLKRAGGRALVMAGEFAPPELHVLAHAMNAALGAAGKTVRFVEPPPAPPPQIQPFAELVADMKAGSVDVLLVLGGNPAFDAPAELGFADALEKVPFRVRYGLYDDETSARCHWQVPEAHFLEAWSDARGHDGTVTIVQPLIEPLYGSKSAHELLAAILEETPRPGLEILRASWQKKRGGSDFETFWRKALHDGVVPGTAGSPKNAAPRPDAAAAAAKALASPAGEGYEIAFRPDPGIHDGRFANNGWLMELPRPMSRVVWDNCAYVSVGTARALGVPVPSDYPPERGKGTAPVDPHEKDVVEVAVGNAKVALPVVVVPGHPDRTITLHLGYGRTRAGRVGNGAGTDVYPIRASGALWHAAGARLAKAGRKASVASTQHHFVMEGRALVRAGTVEEFQKNPEFAREMVERPKPDDSLYPGFKYDGYKWAMAVNLSACTGCNACVVACQSENNIPVVGKDQVIRGREMQWLRIDRYYEGPPEDPEVFNQPVFCMHCEKAPCEVVCPVEATTHSEEGLNEMTYNRCVGTRYCSNNCPYKVRRFNFYEFNQSDEFAVVNRKLPVLQLLANPNVTVRARGVMEKCTYCVQRINRGRIRGEREDRRVRDGEIVTACSQACPTEALVFGDLNDKDARVTKMKAEPLEYGLLEDLNTRPRTTYLAKLTNPNPAIKGPHRA
jgi:molybdopterin-containing oxidoreductase family iron-sulfur binding subunit